MVGRVPAPRRVDRRPEAPAAQRRGASSLAEVAARARLPRPRRVAGDRDQGADDLGQPGPRGRRAAVGQAARVDAGHGHGAVLGDLHRPAGLRHAAHREPDRQPVRGQPSGREPHRGRDPALDVRRLPAGHRDVQGRAPRLPVPRGRAQDDLRVRERRPAGPQGHRRQVPDPARPLRDQLPVHRPVPDDHRPLRHRPLLRPPRTAAAGRHPDRGDPGAGGHLLRGHQARVEERAVGVLPDLDAARPGAPAHHDEAAVAGPDRGGDRGDERGGRGHRQAEGRGGDRGLARRVRPPS